MTRQNEQEEEKVVLVSVEKKSRAKKLFLSLANAYSIPWSIVA